jgi:DNA-binding CsgD family transcriptional regulator/tetratricopeptide (TPR) repeat protein
VAGVTALAGRADETGLVGGLVRRAIAGQAQTVLVVGEPGVGKTSLAERCCAEVHGDAVVLAGACLPLHSTTIPLLALRTAVRGAPGGTDALPGPGADGQVLLHLDAWLDRTCAARPVVLRLDDLQWADQAMLDAMLYLAAGPPSRPLAVVATLRSAGPDTVPAVRRWLAEVRHLPRVTELTLGPLDRDGTVHQVTALLGGVPHTSLVDDVRGVAQGNPYLTRLLVAGLPPGARHLPGTVPGDLRSAVLQEWADVPEGTGTTGRVLAVAGAPLSAAELVVLLAADAEAVRGFVAAGVAAGVLDTLADGRCWFHHPLGAEVLIGSLAEPERAGWHHRLAGAIAESLVGAGRPEALVALADHLDRAGETAGARVAAVRAAGADGVTSGARVRLLARAAELPAPPAGEGPSRREVLARARAAAAECGDIAAELAAVDALLAEAGGGPAERAELLVRQMHLEFSAGRAFFRLDGVRRAVELTTADPTSPAHVLALAELAHAELWHDEPAGVEHAAQALALARVRGDPRALAYAAVATTIANLYDGTGATPELAAVGVAAAERSGDPWAMVHATFWEANAQYTWAQVEHAERLRERRAALVAAGQPHFFAAWLAASEASSWVAIGRVDTAREALRFALGSDAGPVPDVAARLAAARLAVWQGRTDEALAHLARSDELCRELSDFLTLEADAVRAEVLLGAGDPTGAYVAAMAGLDAPGVPPTMCEWLVPLAARALADLAERERDGVSAQPGLQARVDDLVRRFPGALRDIGALPDMALRQVDALTELYHAEVGRARSPYGDPGTWVRAAEELGATGLAWEEAYSWWRAAQAALTRGVGPSSRRTGVQALRTGTELAGRLGAEPLLAGLRELARQARATVTVPGTAPATAPRAGAAVGAGQWLTGREADVLGWLVTGRTYGEIATELVISEKTVSTHVSHLLAKTGTANRVELAAYARRAGLVP